MSNKTIASTDPEFFPLYNGIDKYYNTIDSRQYLPPGNYSVSYLQCSGIELSGNTKYEYNGKFSIAKYCDPRIPVKLDMSVYVYDYKTGNAGITNNFKNRGPSACYEAKKEISLEYLIANNKTLTHTFTETSVPYDKRYFLYSRNSTFGKIYTRKWIKEGNYKVKIQVNYRDSTIPLSYRDVKTIPCIRC